MEAASEPLDWSAVTASGLSAPWVGVRPECPAVAGGGWLWDVVEPGDGRDDPLMLAVEQDLVQVSVSDGSETLRAAIRVRRTPTEIELAAAAMPPPPWRLHWETGWTAGALVDAAQHWLERHQVRARLAVPEDGGSGAGEVFDLGEPLRIATGAFDSLLRMDMAVSGAITRAFAAVLDDLDRRRLL